MDRKRFMDQSRTMALPQKSDYEESTYEANGISATVTASSQTGGDAARLGLLGVNTAHNFEHYCKFVLKALGSDLIPPQLATLVYLSCEAHLNLC